ncbi:hypothetical protein BDR22DRAFT_822938 [Usnea florida]
MGDSESARRLAARMERDMPRLDVVILNAVISPNGYVVGTEGWRSILQINVMATALLGLLLLPKMKASTAATHDLSHLVIVTSEAHRWLELNDFPGASKFGGRILRAISAKANEYEIKLFVMYSESLAALANGAGCKPEVIVTSVCPGACKSDLMRDLLGKSSFQTLSLRIFDALFNNTTEQGGRSYVRAAALSAEEHGKWYKTTALTQVYKTTGRSAVWNDLKIVCRSGDLVTSEQGKLMQRQVWTEIVESLGSRVPSGHALLPDDPGA